ncbi:MAG: DUF4338 domain-containing protein [Gammaproteobacteria bacterium]|nr:DUF4338 domain-containing protein [Gammaproteobacteria bacterium]
MSAETGTANGVRPCRASGWIRVRTTRGRGRFDTANNYGKPAKDVRLRPLAKHWRRILNR